MAVQRTFTAKPECAGKAAFVPRRVVCPTIRTYTLSTAFLHEQGRNTAVFGAFSVSVRHGLRHQTTDLNTGGFGWKAARRSVEEIMEDILRF